MDFIQIGSLFPTGANLNMVSQGEGRAGCQCRGRGQWSSGPDPPQLRGAKRVL